MEVVLKSGLDSVWCRGGGVMWCDEWSISQKVEFKLTFFGKTGKWFEQKKPLQFQSFFFQRNSKNVDFFMIVIPHPRPTRQLCKHRQSAYSTFFLPLNTRKEWRKPPHVILLLNVYSRQFFWRGEGEAMIWCVNKIWRRKAEIFFWVLLFFSLIPLRLVQSNLDKRNKSLARFFFYVVLVDDRISLCYFSTVCYIFLCYFSRLYLVLCYFSISQFILCRSLFYFVLFF